MWKATALALLMAASAGIAQAGDRTSVAMPPDGNVRVGKGVVCNTEQQARRFVALISSEQPDKAIQIVNREASDDTACGAAMIAFTAESKVGEMTNERGTFRIMQIHIVAAATPAGWQPIPVTTQFTAVPDGRDAGVSI